MADLDAGSNDRFIADVEKVRKSRGWSIAELARRAQMDVDELKAVLSGESRLPLDVIMLISRGLDVPPGRLIDGLGEDWPQG
jgi:transcriptional regulator with XRE-family HTH domain